MSNLGLLPYHMVYLDLQCVVVCFSVRLKVTMTVRITWYTCIYSRFMTRVQ